MMWLDVMMRLLFGGMIVIGLPAIVCLALDEWRQNHE